MEQLRQGFMDRPVRMRWVVRIVVGLVILALIGYGFMAWDAAKVRRANDEALKERVRSEAGLLATTISVTSRDAILAKDYNKLQQALSELVKPNGIEYIAVITPDGKAVVHTNARDRGRILDDDVSKTAAAANDLVIQDVQGRLFDAAVPVMGLTRKEATVRVGVAYQSAEKSGK